MTHRDTYPPPQSDDTMTITRRRLLQRGSAAAAAASIALPLGRSEAATAPPKSREVLGRPNFLIFLCDQMRFPPVYESAATQKFRRNYLLLQNLLRANGLDFQRHYTASAACAPSRTSILTGHYPSLHGVSQTYGGAKQSADPDVFWLDPNSVPTFGNYFRAAGYRTYWRGKWHVSDADLVVPGTHTPLLSFDTETGDPDPEKERLYTAANRLEPYGFAGWIGPEPHGSDPLRDSGSSAPGQKGRDAGYAQQTVKLIEQLDHDPSAVPWLVVSSFVNPHDISLWGFWANLNKTYDWHIEEGVVPPGDKLFLPDFDPSLNEDLATKPSCQKSYQESYAIWMQPILGKLGTWNPYYQFYYQVHKDVDEEMMKVMRALLASRFRDDTIVIFTSDHGEMLGAHGHMHQKMYQAYEETTRMPLIIWSPVLFKHHQTVETPTSHIDLAPTLLGLAGIDPEPIRRQLALSHSDARPMVGRDLSGLILGQVDAATVNDPVYYMTDDDPSRGHNQENAMGVAYNSVVQPNHVETVVARLGDGNVWKYSRYFDNPQYWTSPGTPGEQGTEDVTQLQKGQSPAPDAGPAPVLFEMSVKVTPKPDEFEMYNVTEDPRELKNLYGVAQFSARQAELAQLLEEQRAQKRLGPWSGHVPGQPS